MKKGVEEKEGKISVDERNLLSVAYKNVVGTRRTAWRVTSGMLEKGSLDKDLVIEYKKTIENELKNICGEVIVSEYCGNCMVETSLLPQDLLANYLISAASGDSKEACESKVFYCKMKGDYYRYLAEVTEGDEKTGGSMAEFSWSVSVDQTSVELVFVQLIVKL